MQNQYSSFSLICCKLLNPGLIVKDDLFKTRHMDVCYFIHIYQPCINLVDQLNESTGAA